MEKVEDQKVIDALKTVFDPEIPVDLYELGLIYKCEVTPDNDVIIQMTLTTPNCPVADEMPKKVKEAVDAVVRVGEYIIPIDAKFSLDNYNKMIESTNKDELGDLEKKFKSDIKNRIDETAKYIRPNENTTDYAYMFIPADGLYQDLLNNKVGSLKINQRDLVSYAYQKKVMIVSPMSLFPMLQITVKALHNLKVEDSINEILKNVEKLSNHLNAYKTYHDKLGNTLGTAVNHYNDSTKEFKKIDKDVIKISSGNSKLNINSEDIERPLLED